MTEGLTLLAALAVGVAIGLALGAFVFGVLLRRELTDIRHNLAVANLWPDLRFRKGKVVLREPIIVPPNGTISVPLRGTIGEGDRA